MGGLRLGFKNFLRQIGVNKHTSAVNDEFKDKKQTHNKNINDESFNIAELKSQFAKDIEFIKLESQYLKEILQTKDAIIRSKDVIIHSKDVNLEKEMVIRSFLESELLAVKHKLHCRGVIERFEVYRTSAFVGQPKMTRSALWNKILDNDNDLQKTLSELQGFPPSVSSSSVNVVIAKLITEFYRRLSNDIHKDPSGQTMCIINKSFCSDWEIGFMVEICKSIPIRYKVENADH